MNKIMILLMLPIGLFSVFGFMATFEPVENQLIWRSFYAALFLGSLLGSFKALRFSNP